MIQKVVVTVLVLSLLVGAVAALQDDWPDERNAAETVGEGTHSGEINSPDDTDVLQIPVDEGDEIYYKLSADVTDPYFALGANEGSVSFVESINCDAEVAFVTEIPESSNCYVRGYVEETTESNMLVTDSNDERTEYPWGWSIQVAVNEEPGWWPSENTPTASPTPTPTASPTPTPTPTASPTPTPTPTASPTPTPTPTASPTPTPTASPTPTPTASPTPTPTASPTPVGTRSTTTTGPSTTPSNASGPGFGVV